MESSGPYSASYRSSYLQYKHNTSILIRWIVISAVSCSEVQIKPKNNNPKHKKRVQAKARTANNLINSPEVTLTSLVSLSRIVAEAQRTVPTSILALFDSVIRARTAAHECFELLWAETPDEDLKRNNESHKAFIEALKSSWDLLGGAKWRKEFPHGMISKQQKQKESNPKQAENTEFAEFVNRFAGLNVETLASEDEAELDEISLHPSEDPSITSQPTDKTNKGKSKGKRAEPLSSYKIKSENEVYFAVCFFFRDLLEMRGTAPFLPRGAILRERTEPLAAKYWL